MGNQQMGSQQHGQVGSQQHQMGNQQVGNQQHGQMGNQQYMGQQGGLNKQNVAAPVGGVTSAAGGYHGAASQYQGAPQNSAAHQGQRTDESAVLGGQKGQSSGKTRDAAIDSGSGAQAGRDQIGHKDAHQLGYQRSE
jgi:hypothetical protein